MPNKLPYIITPLEHGMATEFPTIHIPGTYSPDMVNVRVDQHSLKKRWGYAEDRDLGTGRPVYNIVIFQKSDGTRYTLYLTDRDLCKKETGTGATFSYKTETYTTGTIDISGTAVTGTSTDWMTGGIAESDYLVADTDHDSTIENDVDWIEIDSIGGAGSITLKSSYARVVTGDTYKIRKVYSVPTRERWTYAIVDDKFCFTNGNIDAQYWTGAGYASALDSTNARQARYCIEYANRLVLADLYNTGTTARDPFLVQWSKEGDPTNWTDSTAGQNLLMETEDFITGLGKVGNNLIVYKRNSIVVANRTGESTAPIEFPNERRGVGCVAPYSIVDVLGTNVFIGRDDFYKIDGDQAVAISENKMRYRLFDVVSETEIEFIWGFPNLLQSEVIWIANTSGGKYGFVWNWKNDEWYQYQFAHDIFGAGKGAV